jgi:hypothetical protein
MDVAMILNCQALGSKGHPPEDAETQPHRVGRVRDPLISLFGICSEHSKNVFGRVRKKMGF